MPTMPTTPSSSPLLPAVPQLTRLAAAPRTAASPARPAHHAAVVRLPSLERWRCLRLCSLEWLAQEAGVSCATIRRAEAGHAVRWSTAERLSDALGVEVRKLARPLAWHVCGGSASRARQDYAAALRIGQAAVDQAYRTYQDAMLQATRRDQLRDPATLRRLRMLLYAATDARQRLRQITARC